MTRVAQQTTLYEAAQRLDRVNQYIMKDRNCQSNDGPSGFYLLFGALGKRHPLQHLDALQADG